MTPLYDPLVSRSASAFNDPVFFGIMIVSGIVAIAALTALALSGKKRPDENPFERFELMDFDMRVSHALRLIAACLPARFADPEKQARVSFYIDPTGMPKISVRTYYGEEVTLPGKTLGIAMQIISPTRAPEDYGIFRHEGAQAFDRGIDPSRFGPRTLDEMDRLYAPVAGRDSLLARHRAARSGSVEAKAAIAAATAANTAALGANI